jgi:phospholipid-binding lipoprotein MlaA
MSETKFQIEGPKRGAGLLALILGLGACSSAPVETLDGQPPEPPRYQASEVLPPPGTTHYLMDANDPWEGFNRAMYTFNAKFDRAVYLPVVRGYERITPKFFRTGVTNFFENLRSVRDIGNSLLQGQVGTATKSAMRVAWNTTAGIAGLIDVATPMGLPRNREDFGQTLAVWGVGDGSYVVLPIAGPANVRDTVGKAVDFAALWFLWDPLELDGHPSRQAVYYPLLFTDMRYKVKFRYYESGSPFEYNWVRFGYGKLRELQIMKK